MAQASLAKTLSDGPRSSAPTNPLSSPQLTHDAPDTPPSRLKPEGSEKALPVFLFPHVASCGMSGRPARQLAPGEEDITDFRHFPEAVARGNMALDYWMRGKDPDTIPAKDIGGGNRPRQIDVKPKVDLKGIRTKYFGPITQQPGPIQPHDDPKGPRQSRLQKAGGQQINYAIRPAPCREISIVGPFPTPPAWPVHSSPRGGDPRAQEFHPKNAPNRGSYSLKLNSHPPFHPPQPSSSERQKVGLLPQKPGAAGNDHPFHRVQSAPPLPGVQLSTRHSLRRRPSSTAGMKECEKLLLRPSLRKPAEDSYQYPTTNRNLKPLLLSNSYQPPHNLATTSRRYSTASINSSRSTNFSHPRTYSDSSNSKRRSTISSTRHSETGYEDETNPAVALGDGGNLLASDYETHGGAARVRSLSESSREVNTKDFQKHFVSPRGETAQNPEKIQLNERAPINRGSPVQSQPTPQRNFHIPEEPLISSARSGSYRSVSGSRNRASSLAYDVPIIPSISWTNSRMGLDGEVHNHLNTGNNTGYTLSNMQGFPMEGPVEKRRVDDFGFLTTLDAASRPYTPDSFAADAGMGCHTRSATRNPSKKSARSLGSTGQHNRRHSVGSIGSSHTIFRSSSAGHIPNVLRKQKPSYQTWPYIPKHIFNNNSRPSSPASATATVGLGIIGAFKEQKKLSKELKVAVEHPHTATTLAGPTRGSIKEDSLPETLPDPYQSDATQPELDFLAREGKARYDAVTREIRELIAAENEAEKQRRIDAHSHQSGVQDTTDFKKHREGKTPSNFPQGSIPQTGTTRITAMSQVIKMNATKAKSPTPSSGYLYVYNESQRIVERLWERGIGIPFANFKSKKDAQRSLRYGPSGKKVKVYMRGARGGSLTVLEKIGRKVGINNPVGGWGKEKDSVNVKDGHEVTAGGENGSDPLGIDLCGAVDITEGRVGMGNLDGHNEGGFGVSNELWKEFEPGELVDPVKEKLEGEGSARYWSSKKGVETESTFWSKLRKFVTKKPSKAENFRILGGKKGGD